MSEQCEIFQAMKEINNEESRLKKRKNQIQSSKILKENGIQFESKNNGVHVIIQDKTKGYAICDFWPSTGLYQFRLPFHGSGGTKGRGVFNLIKELVRRGNK